MNLKPKNRRFIDRLRDLGYEIEINSRRDKAESYREQIFGEPPTWSPVYYWMVIRDKHGRQVFLSWLFGDVNEMVKAVRKEWRVPGV